MILLGLMMVPPQKGELLLERLSATCQGMLCGMASSPPTMRGWT